MQTNTPLKFLVITGAFLSANAALAQNSISTVQVIAAKNAVKTQLLSVNRLTSPAPVNAQAPTANQDISEQTGKSISSNLQFGFDDDSSTSVVRTSRGLVSTRPTQGNVFVSDVATLGSNTKISGLPTTPIESSIEPIS